VIRVLLSASFYLQLWPSSLLTGRPESWDRARLLRLRISTCSLKRVYRKPKRFQWSSVSQLFQHYGVLALSSWLRVPVIIRYDKKGEGRRHVPWLLLRRPYPHDTGKLRMLVHAHLDRAIAYGRFPTLRRFQGFQQRYGPDLTTVCQPDSELTPPIQTTI
jgi:hypothetical protein